MGMKGVALAAILVGLLLAAKQFNLQQLFRDTLAWVEAAGPVGPLVFFGLYIAACVFMLPGSILTLGAGVVFGVVNGSLLVSLSSTVGATAAFLIGRYLAREMVARRIKGNVTFNAMDQAVASEGWKIVGLTRLSPVFPFNLLNYVFGLTRVSLRDYVLASWIGMIPGTVMYVYLGSLAGSLAELGGKDSGRARTLAEWALYVVGLIATVAVTVVITRIARRALNRRINPLAGPKEVP
ncbi:MAG: TVP38/TMEM64 family protein [Syntrophobacterales bacterium]|nr:TVP38/TMEM64 family protein [Syntrophobacterales bacterium]